MAKNKVIALFDVDGTLTNYRCKAEKNILEYLDMLKEKVDIAVVGGSDIEKQKEQLGNDIFHRFHYIFSENGLVAFKGEKLIKKTTLFDRFSKSQYNEFVDFVTNYIKDLDIHVKTDGFIELRTGMINISPIGRSCTVQQRNDFGKLDQEQHIREKMITVLKDKFSHFNLEMVIGGQTSFDVYPKGWSKQFCLEFIQNEYDEIHFFGDRTFEGGNDYEIYHDKRVIGHTVNGPEDVMKQCSALFGVQYQ